MHLVSRLLLSLLTFVSAFGCADNAILELEVRLPANPHEGRETFALIQVRRATSGFETPWIGDIPVRGFPLGNMPRTEQISVVAEPDSYTHDIRGRMKFCGNDTCTALGVPSDGIPGDDMAPEAHLEVEHPFYSLKRTSVSWPVDTVPPDSLSPPLLMISRCQVAGCIDITTNYCRADGTHFCDD